MKEIKRLEDKLRSYHEQDRKKGRLHFVHFHNIECYLHQNITITELVALLERDGLNCYLCGFPTKIIARPFDPKQLTLDRLDNSVCHSRSNVKIACLTCNKLRGNNYTSSTFKSTFF